MLMFEEYIIRTMLTNNWFWDKMSYQTDLELPNDGNDSH